MLANNENLHGATAQKKSFELTALFIQKHPKIFRFGIRVIQKLRMYNMMLSIYQRITRRRSDAMNKIQLDSLTPSAYLIYLDLKAAIAKNRQEG